MLRALFPGSFDPPTNGHLNIVDRCVRIFDEIVVVVASNPQKSYTFSADDRFDMVSEMMQPYDNVRVRHWNRLIVECAEEEEAKVMVRGVRALDDFSYEFELSMINRGLNSRIETLLIPTDPQYFVLRSTAIKELARLDGDITSMVPPNVARRLRERFKRQG
ncbi:MAG: pantetheine-phosphate adenylyltransferase [Spirochaetaceae bacterium]